MIHRDNYPGAVNTADAPVEALCLSTRLRVVVVAVALVVVAPVAAAEWHDAKG